MVCCQMKPEGLFVEIEVWRGQKEMSPRGRILQGQGQLLGTFLGILAQAQSDEKERWRQLTHPISHKIIQRGMPDFPLEVGDVFQCGETELILSAVPYNVAGLGHWVIYYCQERRDLV